jgi:hypothetical protein
MIELAGILFEQDEGAYACICILLQIIAWLLFLFFVRVIVFNTIFPKIRIVDALKNAITYARKCKFVEGEDNKFIYMKVKFKFFPIFRWHTLKIPKPEYAYRGIPLFRKKIVVANGNKNVSWRRMLFTLDIVTPSINIEWNENEEAYQLTPNKLERVNDNVDTYRIKTADTIRRLSQNVNESVRGDAELLKDQYQTGIPISMDIISKPKDSGEGLAPIVLKAGVKKDLITTLTKDIPELEDKLEMPSTDEEFPEEEPKEEKEIPDLGIVMPSEEPKKKESNWEEFLETVK